MLKKGNCVETPKVAPKGKTITETEIIQAQNSNIVAEGQEHHFGSEIKTGAPIKLTTIRISYSTRVKIDALKIDNESYDSVIQRLIEQSATKKCCPARWM
jgi:hypothetical protein